MKRNVPVTFTVLLITLALVATPVLPHSETNADSKRDSNADFNTDTGAAGYGWRASFDGGRQRHQRVDVTIADGVHRLLETSTDRCGNFIFASVVSARSYTFIARSTDDLR